MSKAFNLRRVVDQELGDSGRTGAVGPHPIARRALLRIPAEARDEALLVALAAYVEARMYERQTTTGRSWLAQGTAATVEEVGT